MFEIHVKTLLGSNHYEKFSDLQEAQEKAKKALKEDFNYKGEGRHDGFYIPAHAIAEIRIHDKGGEPDKPERV